MISRPISEAATAGELDVHTVEHVLHSHVTPAPRPGRCLGFGRYDRSRDRSQKHDHGGLIATALASGFASKNPELFPGDVVSEANDRCWQRRSSGLRSPCLLPPMRCWPTPRVTSTGPSPPSAAASALTATEGAVETAEVVDRVLAAFRSEVAASSGAIGAVVPAARRADGRAGGVARR
ncbi:MAG: hypothetical protein R2710_14440 [Acidimicrobiales bacterium]